MIQGCIFSGKIEQAFSIHNNIVSIPEKVTNKMRLKYLISTDPRKLEYVLSILLMTLF